MRTSINFIVFLLLAVVFIGSGGCSSALRVYSDYDRSVHMEDYKTFGWLSSSQIEVRNNPLYYNELNDKRIKKAVTSEMLSRGYSPSDKPQLLLHYHIVIEDKTAVRTDPYGYYYSPYWMSNRVDVFQYSEGTLIIDLMDASNNNLVWRGWVVPFLEDNPSEKTEEEITKAVMMIFSKFPYRASEATEKKE